MTGDCPSDYPIRLPSLFYETIWDTYAFAGLDGEFVLANGDPTGCGYHGDFIMGWDEGFLQEACDQCTNLSGLIQDCPLFDIQTDEVAAQCLIPLPPAIASEDVLGPAAELPGNPAIQSGPGYATAGAHGSPGAPITSTAVGVLPTLSYSAGASIASTATYLPGAVFNAVSTGGAYAAASRAASAYAVNEDVAVAPAAPATTPAPTSLPAGSAGEASTYTTVYSTDAQGVLELIMVDEYVTITPPTVTTTIVTEFPARRRRRRHLHQHGSHHH